jgi:hypothetical protein
MCICLVFIQYYLLKNLLQTLAFHEKNIYDYLCDKIQVIVQTLRLHDLFPMGQKRSNWMADR